MKKHPIKRLIIEAACLLLIIATIIIRENEVPKVEGWTDFKKGALTNFTFVRDVDYSHFNNPPSPLYISYALKREISVAEVDAVYQYTRKYLQSKTVMRNFQNYCRDRGGSSIHSISIVMNYSNKGYLIESVLENDNSFQTWEVKYKNEIIKKYDLNGVVIE